MNPENVESIFFVYWILSTFSLQVGQCDQPRELPCAELRKVPLPPCSSLAQGATYHYLQHDADSGKKDPLLDVTKT